MANDYDVIWNGRGDLTAHPEKDWAVLNRDDEVYWPPETTVDWKDLWDGRCWGVVAIGNSLRRWMRQRRLRSHSVQLRLQRRIILGQRENKKLIGERARSVKLQEQQVIEIRTLYHSDGISFNKLAKKFGISTPTVAQIVNGYTWKHLPLNPLALASRPQEQEP